MSQFQQPQLLMGFLFAFLGTMLFSFKSIFIKLAYAQGLDTNSVLMLRMAIALPIYILIIFYLLKKKGISKNITRQHFGLIIFLGFIGYFLASWLDLKGLEHISASLERLTLFTYPVFVAILGALFFKTPLTKKIIITLLLSYSGLWIVFSQEMGENKGNVIFGTLMVVLSAFSFSFYVLLSKKVIQRLGSLWFTSLAMCVSSVFVLLTYALFFDFGNLVITQEAWLWLFLLAIFSTVIPSFMISEAIARIGPAQTGIVGTMGPLLTISLAVIILNEPFSMNHVWGIMLVMSGVLLLTLKR